MILVYPHVGLKDSLIGARNYFIIQSERMRQSIGSSLYLRGWGGNLLLVLRYLVLRPVSPRVY